MGRIDEALSEARSAVSLDPLSPITNTNLGHILSAAARLEDAIDQLRKTLEIDPTAVHPRYLIAMCLAGQGKIEEALGMLDREAMRFHTPPLFAWVYALAGRCQEASQVLDKIAETPTPPCSPSVIAMGYLLAGNEEKGALWLERGYKERDSQLMHLRSNPLLSSVRSHRKLLEICARMGLPH
jgi:tetratricopeptide (TPR) repeat protein